MTFSIIGRCPRTGQFGAAVATSSIAVGARVPFVRAKVGAVLTQHVTDPRLGLRGLDLLASGCGAQQTRDALVACGTGIEWRQLAVIDAAGGTAAYSGGKVMRELGEAHGRDCVAVGNILADAKVVPAMTAAFEAHPEDHLAERLLTAIEAGLAAGGEPVPVRSASLEVAHEYAFPLVDLRVDAADQPIAALRALWQEYIPWVEPFVLRAVDPDRANSG